MIKRNGDNVFAIASSNNQCQGARSAVSLYPGPGGAATRIPRATAARMTPPDAQHHSKEANIALSTYVEKWKNRYEESERKHKAYLLKSEKGQSLFIFVEKKLFCLTFAVVFAHAPKTSSGRMQMKSRMEILFAYLSDYDRCNLLLTH